MSLPVGYYDLDPLFPAFSGDLLREAGNLGNLMLLIPLFLPIINKNKNSIKNRVKSTICLVERIQTKNIFLGLSLIGFW